MIYCQKMDKHSLGDIINPVRKPVKREGAENYLVYILLSFAASVALTRLFLELTGYPQLGSSEIHIAHVLWGGLLLFVAALLPLILANRWVYIVGALCAGIGVGLFIDEVGKFITESNDYFYPAAAPIIYAFFLLTVLVYFQVRKHPIRDARSELYRALDSIEDILDHDLDAGEHARLVARLKFVRENADHPDLANLAISLLTFVSSDAIYKSPSAPNFWIRWKNHLRDFESRWISQRRLRAMLAGGLLALALVALTELVQYIWGLQGSNLSNNMFERLAVTPQIKTASILGWFYARLILEATAGLTLLVASILMTIGWEFQGIRLGNIGLLLSLTIVNLLVFYFDQFSTIILATIQFFMLIGVIHYRKRYLTTI